RVKSKYGADGIWPEPAGGRDYPLAEYAAPLIGYVHGRAGVAGLEMTQNKLLSGTDGMVSGMTDRTGNFLPWLTRNDSSEKPMHGASLELTINSDIQVVMTQALRSQCEKHKATHGCAIAMDPHNGDILGM